MPERAPVPARWIRTKADERAVVLGYWFDQDAADHVCRFFPQFLRLSTGAFAGKPFVLEAWETDLLSRAYGWKRADGTRRFREVYVSICKKNGKALALDTPIPTPSGWTTMGQLREGDQVFDENGEACRVVYATEVMVGRPCFEVEFTDGEVIVADADHQWWTKSRQGCSAIRTTVEIARTLMAGVGTSSVGCNHAVPVARPLLLETAALPIDPYVLGAWLGDGTSASANITYHESDRAIIDRIEATGVVVRSRSVSTGSGMVRTACLRGERKWHCECPQARLRRLGVLNNKHIPTAYLRASRSQRLALLQGLMDTDGHCTKQGQCEFTTTSMALRDGVMELVRTLGLKPLLSTGRAMLDGRDCGPKYRIQFFAYADLPVFSLSRKAVRQKPNPGKRTRSMTRHIKDVRPVPSVPVRCIQVDSPSHLYLAGRSFVPTHNTSLLAGLALYAMLEERAAEVFQGALNGKQADVLYREAAKLVRASPAIRKHFRVRRYNKTIVCDRLDARLESLTADVESKDGVNASMTIFDEIHRWGGDRRLYDVMKGAGAARRQPMIWHLTTAGDDSSTFCRELHDMALAIQDGDDSNLHFLGVVHAASPDDDIEDEATWKKTNPALGTILSVETFRDEFEQAKKVPARLRNFLRLHLGIWQRSTAAWLDVRMWDGAGDTGLRDLSWWQGREVVAGLDLASVKDLTSLTLTTMDGGTVCWHSDYFLPEETVAERSKADGVPYDDWVAEGHALETPGNATDFEAIRLRLNELRDSGIDVRTVAIDPWNAAHLASLLLQDGFEVYAFRQTFANFTSPCQEVERRLLNGTLRHDGNPITRWCVGNCAVKSDPAGNIRPSKVRAQKNRIDGVVSGIMALGVLTSQPIITPGIAIL